MTTTSSRRVAEGSAPGALLGAGLVLGTVGAARRLYERRRVRQGAVAPVRAVTHALPRVPAGPVARRVATWLPDPPRTPAGRAVAAAWAAPFTALGGLLAAAGGARADWDTTIGCYVARRVAGPSGALLGAFGFDGNAMGQMVLTRGTSPSRTLLAHEAVHVRQFERLGWAMAPLWAWFGARYGYRDNPLERGARRGAAWVRTVRP